MNTRPYIGINGMSIKDIELTTKVLEAIHPTTHDIVYGVQVSTNTQLWDRPNKYGKEWYPVGTELSLWMDQLHRESYTYGNGVVHINFETTEPLALLAFSKYILRKTSLLATYESELGSLYDTTKYLIDGIQLNNLQWDSVDYKEVLESLVTMQNGPVLKRIILQANEKILQNISPELLAKHAAKIGSFISHVLLDGSGGNGVPLNRNTLVPFIDALMSKEIAVGIAGGLSPSSVYELAAPLITQYPTLSIDAETGLRDNYDKSNPASSSFSKEKAVNFVKNINDILN